ncbi:hypothetical protein ACFLWV_03980, partial [Chloroflexota bacterium]
MDLGYSLTGDTQLVIKLLSIVISVIVAITWLLFIWKKRSEANLIRRYRRSLSQWAKDGYDVSYFELRWAGNLYSSSRGGALIFGVTVLTIIIISALSIGGWTGAAGYFPPWDSEKPSETPTPTPSPTPVASLMLTPAAAPTVSPTLAPTSYTLITRVSPVSSGSVGGPSSGAYEDGTQVTLSAIPALGWEFDYWTGTDNDSINPTTVTITSDKSVIAYFIATDADGDGDGLSDIEEQKYGTNPYLADTDQDGLSDYEEVNTSETDPLNADTDGDGVEDGDDLVPLYDAYLEVAITYFESTGDLGDEWEYQEAYFIITVNEEEDRSEEATLINRKYLTNPYLGTFNIPDDNKYVAISIAAWEPDVWSSADHYDISD